ncbi:Exostosin-like [Trinorchestia longiramus]|nr:Exostosin-like [Trinorchestia longiramus]
MRVGQHNYSTGAVGPIYSSVDDAICKKHECGDLAMSTCSTICSMLRTSKILWFILCLLLIVPWFLHYSISKNNGRAEVAAVQSGEDHLSISLAQLSGMHCSSLKDRVEELLRIKASVLVELRELEQQRGQVQDAVSRANARLATLRQEEVRMNTELDRLKSSVDQAMIAQKELFEKNMPDIVAPHRITATHENNVVLPPLSPSQVSDCRMYNCFDHSRCSILSGFPVYVYDSDKYQISPIPLETFVKTTVRQALGYNPHITQKPDEACVFVAIVGEMATNGGSVDKQLLESNLHSLPYWNGDGRNHVLLNLARSLYADDVLRGVNSGRAMVVQSHVRRDHHRPGFDVVASPLLGLPGGDLWRGLPPLVPAKRHYLLSFQRTTGRELGPCHGGAVTRAPGPPPSWFRRRSVPFAWAPWGRSMERSSTPCACQATLSS